MEATDGSSGAVAVNLDGAGPTRDLEGARKAYIAGDAVLSRAAHEVPSGAAGNGDEGAPAAIRHGRHA